MFILYCVYLCVIYPVFHKNYKIPLAVYILYVFQGSFNVLGVQVYFHLILCYNKVHSSMCNISWSITRPVDLCFLYTLLYYKACMSMCNIFSIKTKLRGICAIYPVLYNKACGSMCHISSVKTKSQVCVIYPLL